MGNQDQPAEFSENGQPIIRHERRERPFEFAVGDTNHIEALSAHFEKRLGGPAWVFHEIISDLVHELVDLKRRNVAKKKLFGLF